VTNLEWLRQRLEDQAFGRPVPPLDELRQTEWSPEFEQLMRNRLLMGAFRYGLMRDKLKSKWKMLPSMRRRLDHYEETGNLEMLVDVANLCLLEFLNPSVDGAAMRPTDDGEHVERA
jgi:hypothetical protein